MKIRLDHIFFLLFFFIPAIFGQVVKYWPKRVFPAIPIENAIWVGTPRGLHRYDVENDAWALYGMHTGLPDNHIQYMQYDGEFLWVVTPKGLAAGDIRLNKWLVYSIENGLPDNTVHSIAFQEDYVWIATQNGAARFDKLIEEWEIFTIHNGLPDSVVYDIVVDGDLVYFATQSGLAEYHTQFEKWRYYSTDEGLLSNHICFIYPTSEFLWLFTDEGISRFQKDLKTAINFNQDDRLKVNQIHDLQQDGDQLWLSTSKGVLTYDPSTQIWRSFLESYRLPSQHVLATSKIQNIRYFVTTSGVVLQDEETGIWRTLDQSSGLSQDTFRAITDMNGFVFLMDTTGINYFKPMENRWFVHPLTDLKGIGRTNKKIISLDKEKGSMVQFSPEHVLSLSGSQVYFQQDWFYHSQTGDPDARSSRSIWKNDLKAQFTLKDNRTVNAFYNDRDFSQKQYGIRYKGERDDLIRELNWGDVRYDQGRNQMAPSVNVFGGSARLETGPKTPRYKRSRFFASGFSGHQTSGTEIEFFTGNIQSDTLSVKDIDYLKNVYFTFDSLQLSQKVDPQSEMVFLDDGNSLTNTANTHDNLTIAGLTGDFDRLIPVQDYEIDYSNGFIHIFRPVPSQGSVVITGSCRNVPFEKVLKNPFERGAVQENKYLLSGLMIPYSTQLDILDRFGISQPLTAFGLDDNHDGHVDPQFIDFERGILTFPQARPFPPGVYDDSPSSYFRIHLSYQIPAAIIQLKHNHLIRGSEEVVVDGYRFNPGEDYVLDYTRGTVLIIKEGAVGADSEIEVLYEYYRDTNDAYHRVTLGTGPSDQVIGDVSGFVFDFADSIRNQQVQGFDLTGEFKKTIKGVDIKFSPQSAYSRSSQSGKKGRGFHIRTDLSTDKIRFYSIYEKYDKDFQQLVNRQFRLGRLAELLSLGSRFFPTTFSDIRLQWSRQKTHHSLQHFAQQSDLSGQILLHPKNMPVVSFQFQHRHARIDHMPESKKTIKTDIEYQVPKNILNVFHLQSLRFYGVWRKSWEHGDVISSIDNQSYFKNEYENRYFRWELSPLRLVQFNGYYRSMEVDGLRPFVNEFTLYSQKQKWFLDATVDRIQGTNFNAHFESEVNETIPFSQNFNQNLTLYRILQTQLRLFPGRWFSFLQPVTFQIGYQPTWSGSLRNNTRSLNWHETFWQFPSSNALTKSDQNQTMQFRTDWRPSMNLSLYSGMDWSQLVLQRLDSQQKIQRYELYEKVEYRLGLSSLIVLQYIRNWEEKAYKTRWVRENAFLQVETRWSEQLLSKFHLSYTWRENQTGYLSDWNRQITPRIGLTYRLYHDDSQSLRAEFRDDFSWTASETQMPTFGFRYNTFSNVLALDIYPLSVLILRLRWILSNTQYVNASDQVMDHRVEFRMIAQL